MYKCFQRSALVQLALARTALRVLRLEQKKTGFSASSEAGSTVVPARVAVEQLSQGLGRSRLRASQPQPKPQKPCITATTGNDELRQWESLARRLHLEGQGCLWHTQGARDFSRRKRLETEGKKNQRYVFALHRKWFQETAPWNLLARWYLAAARAVRLCVQVRSVSLPPRERTVLVEQLARCQSALLQIANTYWNRKDNDQRRLFQLARALRTRWHIRRWIPFLKQSDWLDLDCVPQTESALRELEKRLKTAKKQQKLLNKLKHESTSRFSQGGEQAKRAVKTILTTVEQLDQLGCPMSHKQIRQALQRIGSLLPQELPPAVRCALKYAGVGCCSHAGSSEAKKPSRSKTAPGEEMEKVRKVLRGKKIMLVGGKVRPKAKEKIVQALGLKELIWREARPGESVRKLEAMVAAADVFLVLITPRWASHGHTEAVSEYCRKHGKPLVRLHGGYNPRAIAHQIVQQCSRQLSL